MSRKYMASPYRNGRTVDLTGQRYGRLVCVEPTPERLRGSVVWICRCDCGRTTKVSTYKLANNRRRSCGCLKAGDLPRVDPETEALPPSHRDPEAFEPIEEAIRLGYEDVPWRLIERIRADHGGVLPPFNSESRVA